MVSILKRMQARMTSDLLRSISNETLPIRSDSCSGHMNVTLASFPLMLSLIPLILYCYGVKMFAIVAVCEGLRRELADQGTTRLPVKHPCFRALRLLSERCMAMNIRAHLRIWSAPRCLACALARGESPSDR